MTIKNLNFATCHVLGPIWSQNFTYSKFYKIWNSDQFDKAESDSGYKKS